MYPVGASRRHKLDAQRLLESALSAPERLVTDAEVLREIRQRYVAINRREAIQPAFDAILQVVDEVVPIARADVGHAKDTLLRYSALSAREALHVAIIARHNITQLMSSDRGFDTCPGITRLT